MYGVTERRSPIAKQTALHLRKLRVDT